MNLELMIDNVLQEVCVESYRDVNPGFRTVIVWFDDPEDNYIEASVYELNDTQTSTRWKR